MQEFTTLSKVVREVKERTRLVCDICGNEARWPDNSSPWEFGGAGVAGATLEHWYHIDGEYSKNPIDICFECAQALIDLLRRGKLTDLITENKKRF